ncbi:MAG TPA: TlpA disulfide reductase family protein [Streptosporangiaceae bacterium]|nr:TlpA disulfide reductase family protein [Streptosporangiaceae bacterium]
MIAAQDSEPVAPVPPGSWLRRLSTVRKISYLAVVVVAVAVALIVTLAGGQAKKTGPPPLAKSFSLAQLGKPGSRVTLASYAGKPVIVNFFASWCTPCQRETPMLARFYVSMHGRVRVIGVDSNDEAASALRFVRKTGVSYPVGSDPYPATTTTSYGVYALPQTFFLNARHQIVLHILGALTTKDLTKGVSLMDRDRG